MGENRDTSLGYGTYSEPVPDGPNLRRGSTRASFEKRRATRIDSGFFQRPVWTPDADANECFRCYKPFALFRRRHHCRNCGQVFCHSCTSREISIPWLNYNLPVRVCELCHTVVSDTSLSIAQERKSNCTHEMGGHSDSDPHEEAGGKLEDGDVDEWDSFDHGRSTANDESDVLASIENRDIRNSVTRPSKRSSESNEASVDRSRGGEEDKGEANHGVESRSPNPRQGKKGNKTPSKGREETHRRQEGRKGDESQSVEKEKKRGPKQKGEVEVRTTATGEEMGAERKAPVRRKRWDHGTSGRANTGEVKQDEVTTGTESKTKSPKAPQRPKTPKTPKYASAPKEDLRHVEEPATVATVATVATTSSVEDENSQGQGEKPDLTFQPERTPERTPQASDEIPVETPSEETGKDARRHSEKQSRRKSLIDRVKGREKKRSSLGTAPSGPPPARPLPEVVPRETPTPEPPVRDTPSSSNVDLDEEERERMEGLILQGDGATSTATAISNAITNTHAGLFGELKRLESPLEESVDKWRREMDMYSRMAGKIAELVPQVVTLADGSQTERMVKQPRLVVRTFLPQLRELDEELIAVLTSFKEKEFRYEKSGQKTGNWWIECPIIPHGGLSDGELKRLQQGQQRCHNAQEVARDVNNALLRDIPVPEAYLSNMPSKAKTLLGNKTYKMLLKTTFDPSELLEQHQICTALQALNVANMMEKAVVIWTSKLESKKDSDHKRRNELESLINNVTETMSVLKSAFEGMEQTELEVAKILHNKDVGLAILEAYSRVIEARAATIGNRIQDVLQTAGIL